MGSDDNRLSTPRGANWRLLQRLVKTMALPVAPQDRLNSVVKLVASDMIAEVCSVYVKKTSLIMELFATEGLSPSAVHNTRLQVGEGLVGTIADSGQFINTRQATAHPDFAYRPETAEDRFNSFLGVPLVRGGRVIGVLTIQNEAERIYEDDEVETLQIVASVLAESLGTGRLQDASADGEASSANREPVRLTGTMLSPGLAINSAVLHRMPVQVKKLVTNNPEEEIVRLRDATTLARSDLDDMLGRPEMAKGEGREILEAFRLMANDSGWLRRMIGTIRTGLTAEGAVRRFQEEAKLRMSAITDPLLRERMADLDDLCERLLRVLNQMDPDALPDHSSQLPDQYILVARQMGPAELLDYPPHKLQGVVLEEGSSSSHVAIIARSMGIPVLGHVKGALLEIEPGDQIALDADHNQLLVRPADDALSALREALEQRQESDARYLRQRHLPCVTRDDHAITLNINAGFRIDMAQIERTNASGVGLFRTELSFMVNRTWPDIAQQAMIYRDVLDQAGEHPVTFRTLDIGSDKQLAFWKMPDEANPAMGLRGIRFCMARPKIFRDQLRAMIESSAGRTLRLMYPMVSNVSEVIWANQQVKWALKKAKDQKKPLPVHVEKGIMLEVPSVLWSLNGLVGHVDFISVGTNDLCQFLLAADRTATSDRNILNPYTPALIKCVGEIIERCRTLGLRLSICGDMAGERLGAAVLTALGARHLSMAASRVGPVKETLRSLDADHFAIVLQEICALQVGDMKHTLELYLRERGVVL